MFKKIVATSIFLLTAPIIIWALNYWLSQPPSSPAIRPTVELLINPDNQTSPPPNIEGTKIPEFSLSLSENKFVNLLRSTTSEISNLVQVSIVHTAHAQTIPARVDIDKQKQKLVVKPQSISNFIPGKYKLSLKLRTLEGEINIEQDFTWGVIVVNTNKSIYAPGEEVKLGMAVLNDAGETQCANTLFDRVDDLELVITDPKGVQTKLLLSNGTISDSGECGSTSFTNAADFQAVYTPNGPGIYQMTITASLHGKIRSLKDYFKVDQDSSFDIERTSFPTRVYPPVPYPVTFSITPQKDYSGKVTEIVPANFEINHLSDNGQVEIEGDFARIIWNISLPAGVKKDFSYFIKFPMVSPEFYLLGPIKVGNFTEARQWQIASDAIASTTGLVSYEDNAASQTWSRVWTGSAFNAQSSMDTSPVDSRWFKEVSSPKTGEKLVAAFDNNNDGDRSIYMFRWNGSAWSQDFNINPATNWPDGYTRVFDVAYEELSGDALFVYSDTTTQLKYRKRVAGAWDVSDSNAGTAMDSRKRWVEAKSQFGSDSILVGYLNDNERIGALIWDGSTNSFGDQFDDDDSPAQTETANSQDEPFGVAWETQSGTPMIFWGSTDNDVLYRQFTSGSWSGESTAYSGYAYDVAWLTVAADPLATSNNIALAIQQAYDTDTTDEVVTCRFGIWNGLGLETEGSTITCRSDDDGRLNNVAFENNSSRAVWVYGISESGTTGNSIAWRTWTIDDGYSSSTTEADNLSGNIESVQLNSDLLTTSMICLTQDSAGDLNYHSWDGTDWTTNTSDLHSNIQTSEENAEAYGFGFDRNLETLAAYKWFAANNGTSVTTALAAQDSPYTLSEANQQFRLRLLLYYPDTLLTSSGREYKLQYVDPGTGTCASPADGTPSTWTDVPTSSGQINFYDNSSPADGNNLTANAADPTYRTYTVRTQDYEEANNFTNSVADMSGDEVAEWDFSLVDNTTYDRIPQTFCFRVTRSNNLVLQIGIYPQITTAAVADVLIQGDTLVQPGTLIQ